MSESTLIRSVPAPATRAGAIEVHGIVQAQHYCYCPPDEPAARHCLLASLPLANWFAVAVLKDASGRNALVLTEVQEADLPDGVFLDHRNDPARRTFTPPQILTASQAAPRLG